MLHRLAAGAVGLFLVGPTASAQISETFGPLVAPLGCPIHYTFNNDVAWPTWVDPCTFVVTDLAGNPVYTPPCPGPLQLQPGDVLIQTWNQVDDFGQQVPPGTYLVGAPVGAPMSVGGVATSISALGAPKLGTTRNYDLCSPLDAGAIHLLMASTSSTAGAQTCAGLVPLDPGPLLIASLTDWMVFPGFFGVLDGAGRSQAPALALPAAPALAGLPVVLAFVVLDPSLPCAIRRISSAFQTLGLF